MATILIFSLLFAHHNLSRNELGHYECRVGNASEAPGSVRSLGVLLQAPGTAATEGKPSRNQNVITLTCFNLESPMHVNLLYLEKEHRDLRDQAEEKYTLQGLKVITTADRKAAAGHSCVLLIDNKKKLQTKFILKVKVFLVGISDCVMTAKLPKLKVFAEGLTILHVRQDNQTSEERNKKEMLLRKTQSLYIKVFILCFLLMPTLAYIVIVICEFPCSCPCLGWIKLHDDAQRSRADLPAASTGKEASQQDLCKERFKIIVIHETYL